MTLLRSIRTTAQLVRRQRRTTSFDSDAHMAFERSTGDPRLDLARAIIGPPTASEPLEPLLLNEIVSAPTAG